MRGIRDIRITGIIFSASILIGLTTMLASIMTRIFIIGTIVARGEVGIKASMAFVLLVPLVLAFILLEARGLLSVPRGQPVLAFDILRQPVLGFDILKPPELLSGLPEQSALPFALPEPPVLAFDILRPPVLEFATLEPLLLALAPRG